nr:N-acetyl-D-glucosamine kinase [Klebsiella pneumoniae]
MGKRVATPKSSYEDFLRAVEALVREADERFDQQGSVGIGIPGMPETADGTLYAANVPAASGRPLRADLSARLGRDVRLDNDANCFALSEAWDDEFTQYPLVMGLILGTGVGGGPVLNGKSITGHSYITGEFGHIRLPVDARRWLGAIFRCCAAAAASWAVLKIISPVAVSPGCTNILSATALLAGDCGAVAAARSARAGAR